MSATGPIDKKWPKTGSDLFKNGSKWSNLCVYELLTKTNAAFSRKWSNISKNPNLEIKMVPGVQIRFFSETLALSFYITFA